MFDQDLHLRRSGGQRQGTARWVDEYGSKRGANGPAKCVPLCTILAYLVNLVIQFVGAPSAVGWLFLEPKASHRLATSIHTQIMQRLKVLTIISQQVASSTAQMPPLRTHATKIVKRKLLLVCSRFSVDPPKSGFFEVLPWQKEICRTNSCRTCAHFRS